MSWQFDNAVLTFGRHVEHEIEQVKGNSEKARQIKRRIKLHNLLGLEPYQPPIDL